MKRPLSFVMLLIALPIFAQHGSMTMPMPMPTPPGAMPMSMTHDAVQQFLMSQASGTSANPASAPMAMAMMTDGDWTLMLHGAGFVSAIEATGRRGDDALTSQNWLMGMASRPLAGGQLLLRSMVSLEPALMPKRGYPELFQTGETANGTALVDRQHPHDFVMELAAEFAIELAPATIGYIYAAPMGDPSLGPVAYPHRASALELPQATLAHHLEDSTHIAGSVVTLGAKREAFGLAVSAFHGAEPDENRWDLETGSLDSWAVRATWDPTPNVSAQLSTGHLEHPEALEPDNVQRTTASIAHHLRLPGGELETSLIWGHNDRSHGHATNGFTAEASWRFRESNYLTARGEIVDKDELFADAHAVERVRALTVGYTKDVFRTPVLLGGIGGNVTIYGIPSNLQDSYGSRPRSWYAFVRVRSAAPMH
jgi:hypothetical protein